MRIALLLLAFMMAGAMPSSAGQTSIKRLDGSRMTPAEIDRTVVSLMQAAEVPGVGIAIFSEGKVTYLKAYGVRDKDKNLPLTVDSVMSSASFTKVAFAYLAMELVDKGQLDLDKPVYQYLPKPLPGYPNYTDLAADPRYQRITARMLLSHTSGFANFRWLEDDHKLRIHFEPGSRFAYSGEGIQLLQLVVENITKRPLEELMQENVFRPFGMTRTSMVWQKRFENDFANGYDEYGRSLGPARRESAEAAGSMLTTIHDFSLFVQAVMHGKKLQRQTREQMLSSQIPILSEHEFPTLTSETSNENKAIRLSYGLGWGLFWTPYGKAFFKEGHDVGWRNYAVCFDKSKSGIVIMTNSANGEGIYKELLETLLHNSYTPLKWEGFTPYDQLPARAPLKQHKEITLSPALLERYVGRYGEPPNLILTIRRDGNHLSLQENDEPKQEIFAESETEFFTEVNDDTLSFEVNAQSQVKRMIVHADGRDIPLQRIE